MKWKYGHVSLSEIHGTSRSANIIIYPQRRHSGGCVCISKLITICGSIGVGKTTLVKNLQHEVLNSKVVLEEAYANPYIADFFADMKKWSFHSRIAFLKQMLHDYCMIDDQYDYWLFDRSFDELMLFANNLHDLQSLDDRDYSVYQDLSEIIEPYIRKSDLYIFLYCDPAIAFERIKARGFEYETPITLDYVISLSERYEKWIEKYQNVIRIDTSSSINYCEIVEQIYSC